MKIFGNRYKLYWSEFSEFSFDRFNQNGLNWVLFFWRWTLICDKL